MDIKTAITNSYLAQGFPESSIDRLVDIAVVRSYGADEVLMRELDESKDLLLLTKGKAEIRTVTNEVIGLLHEGMPFGEVAFLDEKPRSITVYSTLPCEVIHFPYKELKQLMEDDPKMAVRALFNLSRVLCQRLRRANQQIAALQAIEESSAHSH